MSISLQSDTNRGRPQRKKLISAVPFRAIFLWLLFFLLVFGLFYWLEFEEMPPVKYNKF